MNAALDLSVLYVYERVRYGTVLYAGRVDSE